jgi:phosphate transport system permease protein
VHQLGKSLLARVKRRDRIARRVITLGGLIIIASVLAILLLIVSVTLPLFGGARVELATDVVLPTGIAGDDVLAVGVDRVQMGEGGSQDSLTAFVLSRSGKCVALDLSAGAETENGSAYRRAADADLADEPRLRSLPAAAGSSIYRVVPNCVGTLQIPPPGEAAGQTIVSVERFGNAMYTLLWSDGGVSLVQMLLTPQFDGAGRRTVAFFAPVRAELPPEEGPLPVRAAMRHVTRQAGGKDVGFTTCVKLMPDNRIAVRKDISKENLVGDTDTETHASVIAERIPGPITAMTLDNDGKMLYAGTANGCLLQWEFDEEGKIVFSEVVIACRDRRKITCLALMHGEVSLAVGDAEGEVTTWFEIRNEDSRKLRKIHQLSQHGQAVRDLLPSGRDKSLVSLGGDGGAALDYMTSERQLLRVAGQRTLKTVGYSPRGNALIGLDDEGRLSVWKIDCPHPEVSWRTLFGKVHYEGYAAPEYKWQTTGDEPKFSLVPIVFGTLKCTAYAMLFALPLALLAAVYVSHFTTPAFKAAIKPIVEIMAAVPSVVLGFLILLWLAPLMGRWLVAAFACLLTIPAAFVLFMIFWQKVRRQDWARRVETGYEFLVLAPVVVAGALAAVLLSGPLEAALFGGDIRQWIFDVLGTPYDQLNTLVVAVGLGFAVIPIIFSISEDALSSIPQSLTAASLAVGASRWQTLWRVVLPSASPGIFAAAMIGFGRAVGETMIVFMGSGNTPIPGFNPFNGFRSLSANIAVEMPEADVGGTLFRILFLCGVLLFILTFCLNTGAELVRQHLRKRYGRY